MYVQEMVHIHLFLIDIGDELSGINLMNIFDALL